MLARRSDISPQGLKNTAKDDTPVGQHIRQLGSESGKSELKWKIIDQALCSIKLLTLEALNIRKERPEIDTRDEVRSRELTLRL